MTNHDERNTDMNDQTTAEEKTIDEIKAEHSSAIGAIMNSYLDQTERIRQETAPADGTYLDRLSDQERMSALYQQKVERAGEAYESTRVAYSAQTEAFRAAHESRVAALESTLFKVEDSNAASRAATASESELADMLDYSALSGNKALGQAAFVAAHVRGAGHLISRYFETDEAARDLYQEYSQRVPPEVLERQLDVGRVVQPPYYDRLTPPARVGA